MGQVLILAGTAEARAVCAACAGLDVVASLAGVTRDPADLRVPTRVGGTGGQVGFAHGLLGIAAVLDATHPYAAAITARTVAACAAEGVPYLRLTRSAWDVEPGWQVHAHERACAEAILDPARVFLSIGLRHAGHFAGAGSHRLVRVLNEVHSASSPFAFVTGRPPFTVEAEVASMRRHGITDLVTRNSGGPRAKLDAALALGIAVHLIDRPPRADGEEIHDIARAVAFVRAHAGPRPDHLDRG